MHAQKRKEALRRKIPIVPFQGHGHTWETKASDRKSGSHQTGDVFTDRKRGSRRRAGRVEDVQGTFSGYDVKILHEVA
jgi:hypothetical protein